MFSIVEKGYEKLILMKKFTSRIGRKHLSKKVQLSAARIVTGPPTSIFASSEVNPFI